jgi:hypothetical protein
VSTLGRGHVATRTGREGRSGCPRGDRSAAGRGATLLASQGLGRCDDNSSGAADGLIELEGRHLVCELSGEGPGTGFGVRRGGSHAVELVGLSCGGRGSHVRGWRGGRRWTRRAVEDGEGAEGVHRGLGRNVTSGIDVRGNVLLAD